LGTDSQRQRRPGGIRTKRRQIKEALKAEGHEAYFSEDLVPSGTSIPTNLLELLQTEEMDAVIDLATDFGSTGEAHEMGDIPREKLLLWLPFAARKKFIDEGMRRYVDAAGGRSVFLQRGSYESMLYHPRFRRLR